MDSDTLRTILTDAAGLKADGDDFTTAADAEVTIYLGKPGSAMAVGHVEHIRLEPTHVAVTARDRGVLYTTYESAQAVLVAEKGKGGKRGSVGF